MDDGGDRVTVVVPARDEEAAIGACLDSVLSQDHADLEVLVVDGASTDGTAGVVAARAATDPRVRLLHNARGVIPVSLNLALAEATGTWLVRVDAHASIPPDYVRRAVEHLRTGRWGGVGGRKDGVGETSAGVAVAAAMGSRYGVGGSTYHHGTRVREVEHVPFGAYPVALLRSLGGWDEDLRVNQDFELDWRVRAAGHRILFDPALRIDWQSRQSIRALLRQYQRYGRGKVHVARKHPRSVRPRHCAPPLLVAWLALCAAVAVRRPRLAAAMAAPYAGLLAAAMASTAPAVPAGSRAYLVPAFAAMHLGWGAGFWRGVLDAATPRRS